MCSLEISQGFSILNRKYVKGRAAAAVHDIESLINACLSNKTADVHSLIATVQCFV